MNDPLQQEERQRQSYAAAIRADERSAVLAEVRKAIGEERAKARDEEVRQWRQRDAPPIEWIGPTTKALDRLLARLAPAPPADLTIDTTYPGACPMCGGMNGFHQLCCHGRR